MTCLMVCLEIINLLLEQQHPELFANELDYLHVICQAWQVSCVPELGENVK